MEDVARCTGLWLAEGNTKTTNGVTFTNNCFELVQFFHNTVKKRAPAKKFTLKSYAPTEDEPVESLENTKLRCYTDERASKPYYVLALYSTDFCSEWRETVQNIKEEEQLHPYILQGFFAGEGSVYEGPRNKRILRISQGERDSFLESMMEHLNITYRFRKDGRSYIISRKENWDIFADLSLAELHPRKRKKFNKIYRRFQEEHYPKGELRKKVFNHLTEPKTTKELAELFDRSNARLCDILMALKEDGKAMNYKASGPTYWIRTDQNTVIISDVKKEYLELLEDNPLKIGAIANHFDVRKKSAYKNLYRLQDYGLVKKENHKWEVCSTEKEVIAL